MKGCSQKFSSYKRNFSIVVKLELFRLVCEGYIAMREGKSGKIEKIREKLE